MDVLKKMGIDISPKNKETYAFFKALITEYSKNINKFDSAEIRNYFNNFCAAFMLEYHRLYENFDIKVPYRIKSPKSVFDKLLEYLSREDKYKVVNKNSEEMELVLNEEIKDMFAMTVVSGNTPPTLASNDPEISKLIEEKKTNDLFLEMMQKFRLRVIQDEFSGEIKESYKYSVSRKEYYYHSIMEIERIKSLINPKAVDLLRKYDDMLEKIRAVVPKNFYDRCICLAEECKTDRVSKQVDSSRRMELLNEKFLSDVDEFLDESDRKNLDNKISAEDTKIVDFLEITDDFSARLYDKIDLAILSRQVFSVFEHSKLLKKFNVKLDNASLKSKRMPSGYVADFVYIDTPFGKIEIQLKTQHENLEGNYGYAAHTNMSGKKIKEFELPEQGDEKKLAEFQTCVGFISPKKFLAQFDNTEENRIIIQESGKYQNYKSVISQVKRGSDEDKRLTRYFGKLYPQRDKIFPNPEDEDKVESFIVYDIEEYLASPEYKKLMEENSRKQKNKEQEGSEK